MATAIFTESFETGLPTSYGSTTAFTLSTGVWTGAANDIIRGTVQEHSGSYCCQIRSASGAQITTPNIANVGVSTVTFWMASSTGGGALTVQYSTDGGKTWTPSSEGQFTSIPQTTAQYTATINSYSPNILIQFYRNAATIYLDDVTPYTSESAVASLGVYPKSLSGFSYIEGSGPSIEQNFTVSGTNLTGQTIYITPPNSYEVSFNSSSNYATTALTISNYSGAATTVYTRLVSGLSVGNYNENISISGNGVTATTTVSLSGSVTSKIGILSTYPTALYGFSYAEGYGPSSSQSFIISGANLTGQTIYITPTSNFQISFDSESGYTSNYITIPNYSGSNTTMYTRMVAELSSGNQYGSISITGEGITSASLTTVGYIFVPTREGGIAAKSLGNISLQSGAGFPLHSAKKGSLFTDNSTAEMYINVDGNTMWSSMQRTIYGGIYLPQQSNVTLSLTNANMWYQDTNTTWFPDYVKGVSGTTNGRLYVSSNRGGVFQVIALGCLGVVGTADDFDLGVLVNGLYVPNNLWKSYDMTTGSQYNPIFITGNVILNDNDYISLAIRNPVASGTSTRIKSGYLFLKRIKDGIF